MKLTDLVWKRGTGAACRSEPDVTKCINGIAYLLVKWRLKEGILDIDSGAKPFDPDHWHVWGAYSAGEKIEGETNTDHLKDWGLDIETVALNAEKTQKEHGWLFKDDGKGDAKRFLENPEGIPLGDLLHFSIPVCDLEPILDENGYHHLETKDERTAWIAIVRCTCLVAKGWPEDKYKRNELNPQSKGQRCGGWLKNNGKTA